MQNCRNTSKQVISFSSRMKSCTSSIPPGLWIIPLPSVSTLYRLPTLCSFSRHQDYPSWYCSACVKVNLIYLIMAPKHKTGKSVNLDLWKWSHKVLPLTEKWVKLSTCPSSEEHRRIFLIIWNRKRITM